ncbi:hypothetical protein THTE_4401 [Thermogutta terrifontis]|uniref:Uncharacterized protein n=1 Tax=Thermogutta terrifontis TaxID=1331910 RepID=A0A286RM19_9BACT|nr:hypothetical protein THTE_4401 [Thermogutta terrifontis]
MGGFCQLFSIMLGRRNCRALSAERPDDYVFPQSRPPRGAA